MQLDLPTYAFLQLKAKGSLCRDKVNECDLPEFCTGKSELVSSAVVTLRMPKRSELKELEKKFELKTLRFLEQRCFSFSVRVTSTSLMVCLVLTIR